uniref:Uncharacterized protein n=1 Tax=Globodera rostochiensis TaxID=31243 RepID=A0A914GTC9_GLORO
MNIEKLVRCKIEGLQKMNKHYIAVEQSSVREEETNQSMLHRDSSITSVGDENLEPVEFELGKTIRGKECAWYNVSDDADKQHDIYRSARLHRNIQLRHKKFVLQERAIMTTLQDAEYGLHNRAGRMTSF